MTGESRDKWKSLFDVSEDSPVDFQNRPIGYVWNGSDGRDKFQ
jgi:hypothetical protein